MKFLLQNTTVEAVSFVKRTNVKSNEVPVSKSPEFRNQRHHGNKLANIVLGYLAEHPDASDTLEGIAEWWIMRQSVRVEVTKLAKVLHHLAESSLLEKIEEGDNPRYRLKVEKLRPPS